jgi:bifunctional non-homologous end joining protein LigD
MAEKKLARYNAKRDFKKTAEPAGKVSRTKTGFSFLVQKHAASRLHYDFRLELDGVLKSWAVTRGPSLDPHDRRLAVEVEDHPVSYAGFEGIIPKGEYGGGTVMMWDEGTWEPLDDPRKALKKGSLHFKLHGKRLKGEWTLVRMHDRPQNKGRHNWLLIKRTDAHAKPGQGESFLEKNATSVVTRRRMEQIASDADKTWKSKPRKTITATAGERLAAVTAKSKKGKRIAKLPGFIEPQLATLSTAMPKGADWLHEVKFDGYRILTYIENGKVRMFTRNGLDWTEKFGALPASLAKLPVTNAILDGELVALDEHHVSNFSALKNSLSSKGEGLSYYVFDLLFLDGVNLTREPLIERKRQLEALLEKKRLKNVFYSEHFENKDDRFLQQACSMRLEGVISKNAKAPYHSGRSKTWLKTKCHMRQEFVIGGYTNSSTGAAVIGSLLLGYYRGKDFVYAGRVGTGFDQKMASALYKTLKKLKRETMSYTKYSDGGRRGPGWKRGVNWVEPRLVCEVEFTEWTEDGSLRHPSFQGLREDKPARDIKRDVAIRPSKAKKEAAAEIAGEPSKKKNNSPVALEGSDVVLSSPGKVIFPGAGYTKQDLADYYMQVADWMLPYIAGRPLSLVRCPEGSGKPCFFQRHAGEGLSPFIRKLPIRKKESPYLAIEDLNGLLALVQMGVLEIHNWGSHAESWELPDMIVFDFDPDEGLPFSKVKAAALDMKKRLEKLKLKSFLKTTGGKGLHVVVPVKKKYNWETIKAFARTLSESMAGDRPKLYTTNIRKAQRKGRIFIDYLRNGETATAIAPYSSRAREGAPVAVPLEWSELAKLKSGNAWTIKNLPKRLAKLKKDPWEQFATIQQSLPKLK